ncbi:MAG TPA: EthD family reductase [Burkholderiales bacterium]
MPFCLFVSCDSGDPAAARRALSGARAAERLLVHAPAAARDPFLGGGDRAPALVVQAYFAGLDELQAALPALQESLPLPASCEAMAVRRFAVPQPGAGGCSYLVRYAGPADDPAAWHAHYLEHHAPLMAALPGIRELEVYLPLDWDAPAGPWRAVRSLQRNKVAFDGPGALEAALASPVRAKMRADFAAFPAYRGEVSHLPMLSFEP